MITRPVLRYHGGKFRLREWVTSFFPPHDVYVEPFGGAASVLLAKYPSRIEVYNDLSGDVVNLFRVLREPCTANRLRELLELTPFSREEFMSCWELTDDPVEHARRLIVKSFQSIGAKHSGERTGWRTRTAKSKWSPTTSWRNYCEALPMFTDRLLDVVIENLDWRKLIPLYDAPNALFYVDPPYPLDTRKSGYTKVYCSELTEGDHAELCDVLKALNGMGVLSSYRNPIYDELLSGWERRDISTRAQTNAPRTESIYLSPRVSATFPNLFGDVGPIAPSS